MTDLVARLRLMAGPLSAGLSKSGRLAECLPACLDAAEEIERLRGALKLIVECAVTPDDIDFSWLKMKANEALTSRETDR